MEPNAVVKGQKTQNRSWSIATAIESLAAELNPASCRLSKRKGILEGAFCLSQQCVNPDA